ncbi:thioesterase family protein [Motiliproteus coralliicola]|uniref:Thioesterase family protein n=1 Tax=Motiliproteus coralliicola TaxID=2283196 RepID=A0A369WL12_9GAMM|nr:thioesterase family protein [Motiliproteus coralliicola]RDE22760.1 thioesterase family protein [Motiliproteus coralliicola]
MLKTEYNAFFHQEGDWFVGNDPARGPWSIDACHAGPPTGLIVRALELRVTDKQLVRLTVNLLRPITMNGFQIETEIIRDGRSVCTASALLKDRDGRICASAQSLHIRHGKDIALPTTEVLGPCFEDARPGEFPVREHHHDLPFFADGIEVAYPPGQDDSPGPTTLWMRTLPLLEGEVPSPFQRLCPLADCGNGISRNCELAEARFMNPDVTIAIHRLPESEWLASEAVSHWPPGGIGTAVATLFDQKGAIGTAIQTLLVEPHQ